MTIFRKTVLAVIAVIVAGAALTVLPRPAEACYCGWWGRADSVLGMIDFDDISVAFAGRQIDSGSDRRVFQVERVYKGRAGPVLEFHTPDSATCGTNFTGQGIEGAVAFTWQGKPSVSFCDQVTVEDLEAAFGPGYPPDETMVYATEPSENPDATPVATIETTIPPETPADASSSSSSDVAATAPSENANDGRTTAIFLLVGGGAVVLVGGAMLGLRLRRAGKSGNRLGLRPGDVDLLDEFRPTGGEGRE